MTSRRCLRALERLDAAAVCQVIAEHADRPYTRHAAMRGAARVMGLYRVELRGGQEPHWYALGCVVRLAASEGGRVRAVMVTLDARGWKCWGVRRLPPAHARHNPLSQPVTIERAL